MPKKTPDVPQNSTIFSDDAPLTAQQRAAQKREEKSRQKAEKHAARTAIWSELKERLVGRDKLSLLLTVLIVAIVIVMIVVLFSQIGGGGWDPIPDRTYYVDNVDVPEMPESGVGGMISEAYYTENGGMFVLLNFANAENTTQHPTRIRLKIQNEKGEVIASCVTDKTPPKYFIIAGGYKEYKLKMPAECIKIADDPLTTLDYELIVESETYTSTEGD